MDSYEFAEVKLRTKLRRIASVLFALLVTGIVGVTIWLITFLYNSAVFMVLGIGGILILLAGMISVFFLYTENHRCFWDDVWGYSIIQARKDLAEWVVNNQGESEE